METYNYKNISVNVTTLNPDWVDQMGETVLKLDSDFVAELIENSCTFGEFYLRYDIKELFIDEFEEDEDKAAEHFRNLNKTIEIGNADAIIAVYEYCLSEEDREFQFEAETENISWVIHDILHAVHDAAGCTIYVASAVERERILKSLTITKEKFPNHMPDFLFLENLENEFYSRFKEGLDLDEFKYTEEEFYQ